MARLTRKEAHDLTRSRLLATATELFLSAGYQATSLEKVAEDAGYSKGAVYSNFGTKHDLGLEVLDAVHAQRAQSLGAALAGHDTMRARIDAFAVWAEANIGDVGWTTLEVEFALSSRHDPLIARELGQRRAGLTKLLALLIEAQAEEFGLTLADSPEDLAVELLGLGIGLGVQRAVDPTVPVTSIVRAVERVSGLSA